MALTKLSEFGHNFQIKSIVCFMTQPNFLQQVHDIVDEKLYEGEAMKWVVKQCREYFREYKQPITLDAFKVKVKDINNDVLQTTTIELLKDVYQHFGATDLQFIQDKTLDFFKNQALKNAIVESVDVLEQKGDFELIRKLIDTALASGTERNIGHEYFEDIDLRYEEMARHTVATPWPVINELTQGGLASGELGVIVAPAGVGKSWILAAIGAGAIRNGKTVVHYSLELNEAYVGLRYDSIYSGVANQNLKYHKEEVKAALKPIKGELFIKYYPTKTASVNNLSVHLEQMITLGTKPDMIIVDYADIMRDAQNSKEVRHALGNVYEDLRGLAGQFDIPVWTASQANRSALDEDVIEAQKVSESYIKIMTADFVMSLSRKVEDKIANTGRFHIIKNRFGPDGITYPAKINANTGMVDIYESGTVEGKQQQHKIDNRDNLTRKLLSSKYEDLMGEG
jgi:archaellum biogenesis ATPase FlaH